MKFTAKFLLKAMPDMGYSKFNDREDDLSKLEWSVWNRDSYIWIKAVHPNIHEELGSGNPGAASIEIDRLKISSSLVAFEISYSEIASAWKGSGLGQMLYDRAVLEVRKKDGDRLYSGDSRTPDARRAWARLSTRYQVRRDNEMGRDYIVLKDEV